MPINLYGQREMGVGAEIGGRTMRPMGRGGMRGKLQSKLFKKQQDIKSAVDAWGMDTILQLHRGSSEMIDAVRDDLRQMQHKAMEARKANDVETYKMALQQSLHDQKMLAYADQLNKTRIGDILTGLISALGTIGLIGGEAGWFDQPSSPQVGMWGAGAYGNRGWSGMKPSLPQTGMWGAGR